MKIWSRNPQLWSHYEYSMIQNTKLLILNRKGSFKKFWKLLLLRIASSDFHNFAKFEIRIKISVRLICHSIIITIIYENRKTRDIYWSRDPIFMIFTNLKLSYNFNSIDMSDGMTWYHNYGCVNLNALEALENRKSRDSLIMRGQKLFLRVWLEFRQKML